MDEIVEIAKLFKERDNVIYPGPHLGVVVKPPPEIQVALGDHIMLYKEHLVIAAHVVSGYKRQVSHSSTTGDLSFHLKNNPPAQEYTVTNFHVPGVMEYTDTLKEGDEVIIIPSYDKQTYYLVDKAVKL